MYQVNNWGKVAF